jgi:hypothetical protein
MYICIYICLCIYMYLHIYIYVYICIHLYINIDKEKAIEPVVMYDGDVKRSRGLLGVRNALLRYLYNHLYKIFFLKYEYKCIVNL